MSVLIKGIKVRRGDCWACPCLDGEYGDCNVLEKDVHDIEDEECPLIELPDHGDLVDRDELMMKMWEASAYAPNHCSWVNARVVFAKDIEDAPVVIQAERSEK